MTLARFKRARALRRDGTDAETVLWHRLRNRQLGGFKFVRQEPVGRSIVDFVCREHRLVVELDGGQHAENASDDQRDAALNALGYRIVRIWNHEMLSNPEGVLTMLLAVLRDGDDEAPSLPRPAGERSPRSGG